MRRSIVAEIGKSGACLFGGTAGSIARALFTNAVGVCFVRFKEF